MSRDLSAEELATYKKDGVVFLKNAVDPEWVERMQAVVQGQLDNPSKWKNDANPGNEKDRFFTDRYLWRDNAEIGAFIRESGCAKLAAQAMESASARFYFDHILVKEPGTPTPTPWHQDVPYWPFLGKQIASIWLALSACDASGSGLEFLRGSHADDKYYAPESFGKRENHPSAWQDEGEGDKMPDIEADRASYDIVSYEVEPGDALLFSAWTIHGAPGNSSSDTRRAAISTRWLGDDAIWHPHQGCDPTVGQDDVSIQPGEPARDDNVFPVMWQA